MIDLAFFALAFLAPWMLGFAIVKPFLNRRSGYLLFAMGSGYVLGWFVTTFILRLYDYLQRPFDVYEFVAIECILILPLLFLKAEKIKFSESILKNEIARPSCFIYCLCVCVILLLLYRWGLTAIDLVSKPLYPWDGWFSWSAKGKAFYFAQKYPIFDVEYREFWTFEDDSNVALVGGLNHPYFVSLIQAYTAMAWGVWDDGIVNMPWLGCSIALALSVLGGMLYLGNGLLVSVITCYAVISLPVLDAHASLGAYADLWVGAAFLMSTFFLAMFCRRIEWRLVFLFFIFLGITYSTKNSSLIFLIPLIFLFIMCFFDGVRGLLLLLLLLLLLVGGLLNPKLSGLFQQLLSVGTFSQTIIYNPFENLVWQEWIIHDNWHYAFMAGLISLIWFLSKKKNIEFYSFIFIIVSGVSGVFVLLFFVFFVMRSPIENLVTFFNRASLYFMPVFVLISACTYRLTDEKVSVYK